MVLLLKNLVFTIVVPGTVAGFLPYRLFGPYETIENGYAALGAGGLLIAAGISLYVASIWPFASIGRGTPAPIDAPRRLVVAGPYRIVRNPMYIAVLCTIFGQATVTLSSDLALYGLGIAAMFGLLVIAYEEPALRRRFGDEFEDYCDRVPRWVPRIPEDWIR